MNNLQQAVAYWNYKLEHDYRMGNRKLPTVSVEECVRMRKLGYIPMARLRFFGFDAEIISFPYPSRYGASISVREPGDDTTMVEAAMNPSVFHMVAVVGT